MEGETATSGVGEGRQQVSHTPAPRSRHIPEDVNGNPATSDMQLQGPRGGPRLISINRTDQGFGFTLRHFIVYPPELSELLSDDGSASAAVPLSSLDPLDTIFVKHVKLGSPAHLAGLRTGDRVVSVNGEGVGSRSYQEVVATIQRSPPTLHLMVVPRQQDLLQQVFGETAHNPESNLDIRMPSPGLLPLQHPIRHPLTASLTHASLGGSLVQYPPSLSQSTWSSQSSLASHLSTMSTGHHPPTVMVAHPPFHQKSHQSPKVTQPHGAHIPILPHQQLTIHGNHSSVPYWPGTRKHSLSSGDNQTAITSSNRKQSLPGMADRRQAVYTIQNSLSSVPHYVPSKSGKPSPLLTSTNLSGSSTHASSNEPSNASVFGIYEPILDRAIGRGKVRDSRRLECDPDGRVYEVVQTRVVESKLNSNGNKKGTVKKGTTGGRNNSGSHHDRKSKVGGEADAKRVRVQSLSPPRLKVDQIHARSASVHPRPERPSVISSSNNVLLHGSHQSLSSTKNEALTRSGNKHNSYSRRSCTEPIISNKENSQTNDKSTQEVIDRIKKNVERKEEFLKRPNQPIWLPASKAPIIHSDYHVNPQRLPRPMWPPPAAQTPPSPGSVTKALSFIVSPKQDQTRKVKPDTEQAQPLDSSASVRGTNVSDSQSSLQNDGKTESSIDPVPPSGNEITNHAEIQNLSSAQSASTVLPRSLVGNAVPKPYSGSTSEANPANARYGKAFVTTLSRIQENIAIPELGSSSSLTSQGLASSKQGDTSQGVTPGGTPSGSETSLNSSIIRPIPLAWVGDNERIKQLQIVSKRAKQFESSQLEKEASCKSAFHRFELSRLSQRSKIPNVAQRKQEFEKRDNDQLPLGFEYEFGTHYNNSPRQRKSAELVRSNLVSQELSPSPAKVFRSLSDGGNVFPVSRRLYSPGHDEGRNSSSVVEESTGLRYGMNRTIPVGGPNIHCTPPSHRPHSDSGVLERERSNSVCSQVSMTSLWSTQSMDETGTNRQKSVARQNSYLSALRSPLPDGELAKKQGATNESPGTSTTTTQSYPQPAATTSPTSGHAPRPKRPTFLPIKNHARPALSSNDKQSPIGADKGLEESSHDSLPLCRNSGQRGPPCSPHSSLPNSMYQLPAVTTPPAGTGGAGTPGGTSGTSPTTSASVTPTSSDAAMVARRNKTLYGDEGERLVRRVSYLKATSGDRMYSDSDLDSDNDDRSGVRGEGVALVRAAGGEAPPEAPTGPVCVRELPSPASLQSAIVRQGALHVKLTMVDGKKAGDRSWKAAWAVLQGHAIIFYKDRQHAIQTPLGVEEQISLRGAEVEVASDYTKRRNVLRLATPGGSQLLLQADTPPEMLAWLSTLQNNCALQEGESGSKTPMNNNNVSPQTSNKAMRKLTSTLRTRSPTGQSPSTKTRKPSSSESNSSPKSKTWRGHLKRPFMKKVHSGSPAITPTMPLPEGATIGVCLEDCPPSLENEYVPLLVALCVGVVEGRGLQTQGIYRIPGNKAAVTHLTEMINKDPKSIEYDDPRWCDVNVISSMLKQFFQKLPDPLFTIELYPLFIEASKIEDPSQRMVELKKLVQELPYHHYETLRFLIMHLNNIVSHSDMNKMDVRNLAIVFGPTLVRSGDDNMVTMVTDMSHQCRIVETLISQAAWFFSEDDGEEIVPPVLNHSVLQSPAGESLPPSETDTPSSQALLLHNIQKVEGNIKADMKKDIVSSIISAANRKVHKVKCKKAIEDKPIDDSRHSDKDGGFEERDIDKEAELRKQRLLAKQIESMIELPDPKPMSERKISNMSLMSVQSHSSGVSNFSQSLNNDRTSGSEATKLSIPGDIIHPFCVVKKDGVSTNSAPSTLPTSSTIENTATSTQQSSQLAPETTSLFGDEVAIRSYAGLSASTQERIRRFEMETRAMLHRDLTRHRRETERRDVERQRLEELWQRAKQDMESEDILDQMADNPTEVVRKISDLSWRLQGLRESVDGDRGSLASQSSSPQAALISAALSHHPLSNTSLTPTTNSTTQILNGPETGMPRCGSLDSLRDGPHIPHDDGSDLLSAITATFEEKMRSLQESHLGLVTAVTDDYISSFDPSSDVGQLHDHTGTTRGKTECRLYRDPSLHRRRTNPRNPSLNASTSSSSSAANAALTSTISQVEAACQAAKFVENENKLLSEEVKCDVKVKRSDSLTKSEKTENNLKEKTEKRARELKRTDTQESLSEKKPKEMKRSDNLDGTERSRDLSKKSEVKDNSVGSTRRTSEVRSRRHNVKELKEKFEQNTSTPSSTNPMKPSTVYSNVNNNSTKTNKSSMRRTGYRGHIKRRHTVGGTKDLAKWAWLQSAEVSRNAPRSTRLSAWERLQPLVADERLNTDRTLEAWLAHERIRTSSPDLSRPQQLVLHCDMDDKENLHRRLSVQEATLNPLYPLLESHV